MLHIFYGLRSCIFSPLNSSKLIIIFIFHFWMSHQFSLQNLPKTICTGCNLVEPFSEYIVHLTPEPLLESQHCFIILQAHFVFLEFFFLFDHNFFMSFALFSMHPSSVRYLYILGLRVAISFIIFHPIRLSSTNYSFVFVYWYRSLDFTV